MYERKKIPPKIYYVIVCRKYRLGKNIEGLKIKKKKL
jgi:hypothetical protein